MLRGVGYGLALVVAGLWVNACAQPQPKKPDVEYVPTPQNVVVEMLQLLAVKPTDIVYDLGTVGQEAMVWVLGQDAVEVSQKVLLIRSRLLGP